MTSIPIDYDERQLPLAPPGGLAKHAGPRARIVIAGGPRTGKSTLARELAQQSGAPIYATDSLIAPGEWSRASDIVKAWLERPGPWILEGVTAVRGVRKWLVAHPDDGVKLPFDVFIWRRRPKVETKPGHTAMRKACETIYAQIRPLMMARFGWQLEEEL